MATNSTTLSEFGAVTLDAIRETENTPVDDPDYERPALRPNGFYQTYVPDSDSQE